MKYIRAFEAALYLPRSLKMPENILIRILLSAIPHASSRPMIITDIQSLDIPRP